MPILRGLFLYPLIHNLFIRPLSFLFSQIAHIIDEICPRCRPFWHNLPRFYRQLITNLIVGLTIAVIIMSLHNSRWITEFEDNNVDWLMNLYRGSAPQPDKPSYPFVWIDIDEETYQAWGEPLLTPRDKLRQLLHFAVLGKAAVIVVDIDLSYPRVVAKQKSTTLSKADLDLYNYLFDYEAKHCKEACPHIILARSFRKPSIAEYVLYYPAQRRTFLDDIVAKSPHLHWASVLFERERDRLLRRWRLWEGTCTAGKADIVPSVPLLTLALITDPKSINTLNKQLQEFLPYRCDSRPQKWWPEFNQKKKVIISDWQLHPQPSGLNRRIFYTIPWRLNPGNSRPKVSDGRFLLEKLSPLEILKHPTADGSALLHDSITVIGGSYIESRDLYATPLGWMPGVLVLINAVHSLLQHGELNAPPSWVLLLAVAGVIVLMSFLFSRFDSFLGVTLSGLAIIIFILPVSFWWFKYGVWLDFAIPLLIVQWRQMAANYEEAIKKCMPTDGQT